MLTAARPGSAQKGFRGGGGDQQAGTGAGQTALHGEVHSSGQKQPSSLKKTKKKTR